MGPTKYISVKEIIATTIRDYGIDTNSDWNWENFIEWAAEAENDIGSPTQFIEQQTDIPIGNFKGFLPCNLVDILAVYYGNTRLYLNNHTNKAPPSATQGYPNLWYHLEGDCIVVSYQGIEVVKVIFNGYPTDEEGYPLIKATFEHRTAISKYIGMQMSRIGMLKGTINPNIYEVMKKEWIVAKQHARATDIMPTQDGYENIARMWIRMKPDMNAWRTGFVSPAQNDTFYRND